MPAKPKPGEGWSRATQSRRWIGFSLGRRSLGEGGEEDGSNRRRRRYPAANPSRNRGTNALGSRRGDRSTPKTNPNVLPCHGRPKNKRLLKAYGDPSQN